MVTKPLLEGLELSRPLSPKPPLRTFLNPLVRARSFAVGHREAPLLVVNVADFEEANFG